MTDSRAIFFNIIFHVPLFHDKDFMGFHHPDDLVLTSSTTTLDLRAPAMTLATCQALCRVTEEESKMTIVEPAGSFYCNAGDAECSYHTRCVCAKGTQIELKY